MHFPDVSLAAYFSKGVTCSGVDANGSHQTAYFWFELSKYTAQGIEWIGVIFNWEGLMLVL